jgi:hypothetical protein
MGTMLLFYRHELRLPLRLSSTEQKELARQRLMQHIIRDGEFERQVKRIKRNLFLIRIRNASVLFTSSSGVSLEC